MSAQVGDLLILDGTRQEMAFCPPIPEDHPRIASVSFLEASADESIPPIILSTACWRQYQATWQLEDDRFSLVDLKGVLRLTPGPAVLADWFTGVLRVPQGELLEYVHMGFGSVYEEERHIKIENGLVVGEKTISNVGKRHERWELAKRNLPGMENSFPGDDEL